MFKQARPIFFVTLFLAAPMLRADVKLPAIIGDNMALQQGIAVPIWGWADPGEEVSVTIAGQTKSAKAGDDKKWSVKLDALKAGGPLEMTVKGKNTLTLKNILVGEVWVCSGQSNMEFSTNGAMNAAQEKADAKFPNIRLFTVKKSVKEEPQSDCEGKWVECSPETVGSFSAVGYFFGRHLYKELNVPIGLIHTSWGGTPAEAWTTIATMQADPDLKPIVDRFEKAKTDDTPEAFAKKQAKFKDDLEKFKADQAAAKAENKPFTKQPPRAPLHAANQNSPATLYNGMIAPIVPYAIAGATWYQGESNAGRAMQYRKLLPAMIGDWRKAWGEGDFPFMIVQLANYMKRNPEPGDSQWAELREAQTLTAINTPKTGIGLAIDIGDATNIHPTNKQDVGLRLALQALKIAYNKDIPFSGPMYDSMSVEGSAIRLKMKYTFGGLVAKDGDLKGFAIAGDDKKFEWANAKIDGDSIVVSSDKVAKPVAVRYAWADNPDCNLYNKANLPAVPFRTDNWKGVTEGRN
ncbi:MAG TPA: sialate O-acetylesterase [Planctomycetota bacterium]|nr:sialate O-acetylesterase [Planctomycetota bacterium]